MSPLLLSLFFFFNDTATTEIYTLSLHDALPISQDLYHNADGGREERQHRRSADALHRLSAAGDESRRSEEHTSELQSPDHLVCRLLLEKKKTTQLDESEEALRSHHLDRRAAARH